MADSGGLGITLDGSALAYIEDRLKKFIGKDAASTDEREWIAKLQRSALLQCATVQSVGMNRPVPFQSIYQPTRLLIRGELRSAKVEETYAYVNRRSESIIEGHRRALRSIEVFDFLNAGNDAVIFAGPGWGKTTFLHHIYRRYATDPIVLPLLITLNRVNAVADLERFTEIAGKVQKKQDKSRTLLLVDGYDELSSGDRKRVSEALQNYQSLGVGTFYLTCREYYQVYHIAADHVRIDSFSPEDTLNFVRAFLAALQSKLDPRKLVTDLNDGGFADFLEHPLLLALACIVRTSPSGGNPRSALRLLARALEILCYRWDESKGVGRKSDTELDAKDRIDVMKRIAYVCRSGHIKKSRAELEAKNFIVRNFLKADPNTVLMEIAQFYGILVPSDDAWEFVHRTIRDFLAAQYWVESNEFAKATNYPMDSRTAYAACQLEDCAYIIEKALESREGIPVVSEIFNNAGRFNASRVADALVKYFSMSGNATTYESSRTKVVGDLSLDFLRQAHNGFLNYMVEHCSKKRGPVCDLIVGQCLLELAARHERIEFQTYEIALAKFGSPNFVFNLTDEGTVRLDAVDPTPRRRLLEGK